MPLNFIWAQELKQLSMKFLSSKLNKVPIIQTKLCRIRPPMFLIAENKKSLLEIT